MLKYQTRYPIDVYAPFKDSEIIGKPVMVAGTGQEIGSIVGIDRNKEDGEAIIYMELEDTDLARKVVDTVGWEQTPTVIDAGQEKLDV